MEFNTHQIEVSCQNSIVDNDSRKFYQVGSNQLSEPSSWNRSGNVRFKRKTGVCPERVECLVGGNPTQKDINHVTDNESWACNGNIVG